MLDKGDIAEVVYRAIDELNAVREPSDQIEKSGQTALLGRGSALDSNDLVNLIVIIEELLLDKFNVSITLADERAMSRTSSPFRTVDSIVEYIGEVSGESEDE